MPTVAVVLLICIVLLLAGCTGLFVLDLAPHRERVSPAVWTLPLLLPGAVAAILVTEQMGVSPLPRWLAPMPRVGDVLPFLATCCGLLLYWSASATAVALVIARALRPGSTSRPERPSLVPALLAMSGSALAVGAVPGRARSEVLGLLVPWIATWTVGWACRWLRPGVRMDRARAHLSGLEAAASVGLTLFVVAIATSGTIGPPLPTWLASNGFLVGIGWMLLASLARLRPATDRR